VLSRAPIDKLIITDIYDVAGREKGRIKEKISAKRLIKAINKPWAIYLPKGKIINHLKRNLKGREVVIIMGAGDIYKLVDSFT
jgi:UDP-N-acetylmuramate-alanine ligase